jgi:hypothetical protein
VICEEADADVAERRLRKVACTPIELSRRGVSRILITNRNHVRAANKVRERTRARCYIHPEDAAYAKGQGALLDVGLHEGERIGPLEVIGVSGKSPGEVAFLWKVRKTLILGDAVVGNPPGQLSLLRERVMDDRRVCGAASSDCSRSTSTQYS